VSLFVILLPFVSWDYKKSSCYLIPELRRSTMLF